jgi:hypothetical protein
VRAEIVVRKPLHTAKRNKRTKKLETLKEKHRKILSALSRKRRKKETIFFFKVMHKILRSYVLFGNKFSFHLKLFARKKQIAEFVGKFTAGK